MLQLKYVLHSNLNRPIQKHKDSMKIWISQTLLPGNLSHLLFIWIQLSLHAVFPLPYLVTSNVTHDYYLSDLPLLPHWHSSFQSDHCGTSLWILSANCLEVLFLVKNEFGGFSFVCTTVLLGCCTGPANGVGWHHSSAKVFAKLLTVFTAFVACRSLT
jgi:hypothetical protein